MDPGTERKATVTPAGTQAPVTRSARHRHTRGTGTRGRRGVSALTEAPLCARLHGRVGPRRAATQWRRRWLLLAKTWLLPSRRHLVLAATGGSGGSPVKENRQGPAENDRPGGIWPAGSPFAGTRGIWRVAGPGPGPGVHTGTVTRGGMHSVAGSCAYSGRVTVLRDRADGPRRCQRSDTSGAAAYRPMARRRSAPALIWHVFTLHGEQTTKRPIDEST